MLARISSFVSDVTDMVVPTVRADGWTVQTGYPDILGGEMKVLVSIDERLLRQIDRVARQKGMTRSAYLAELAAQDIGLARGPGASKQTRDAMRRLDRLFQRNPHGDATAAIRAERDARAMKRHAPDRP